MKHVVRSSLGRQATLLGVVLAATTTVASCNTPAQSTPPATRDATSPSGETTRPSPNTPPPAIDPGSQVPIPEKARQQTPAGAAAFVQFLIDETNRAYLEPRPGALLRLCAPDTPPCNDLDKAMVNLTRDGKRATGPVIKDERYLLAPTLPDGRQQVAVDITLLDYEVSDPTHQMTPVKGEPKKTYIETLSWGEDGWKVVAHEYVK